MADGIDQAGDGLIVAADFSFKRFEFDRQILVCGQHLAELNKGADNE